MPRGGGLKDKNGLTAQERKFLDAYEKRNWSQSRAAAAEAGFNPNWEVPRLMARPAVRKEIERRQEEERRRHNIDIDWVLSRLINIADGSLGDVILKLQEADYDLSVLSLNERSLIAQFEEDYYMDKSLGKGEPKYDKDGNHVGGMRCVKNVKVKFHSKLDALEKLCRHLGMFNKDESGKVEVTIVERLQAARQSLREKKGE